MYSSLPEDRRSCAPPAGGGWRYQDAYPDLGLREREDQKLVRPLRSAGASVRGRGFKITPTETEVLESRARHARLSGAS